MNNKGMFWGSNDQTSGVKVFGMENVWGNLWRRTAGWMFINSVQKVKLTRGTHDGSTASDYNTDGSGYISVANSGISGSSGGYISGLLTADYGHCLLRHLVRAALTRVMLFTSVMVLITRVSAAAGTMPCWSVLSMLICTLRRPFRTRTLARLFLVNHLLLRKQRGEDGRTSGSPGKRKQLYIRGIHCAQRVCRRQLEQ